MTMALLDRVVDRTKPITFEGESFRGEALRKLKKASVEGHLGSDPVCGLRLRFGRLGFRI